MSMTLTILTFIGDMIFKLLGNKAARGFLIKKLGEAAQLSDNKVDDTVVNFVGGLLGNEENVAAAREMYEKHVPHGVDTDLIQQLKDKVAKSDNSIDDQLVSVVESALSNEKNLDKVVGLVDKWTSDAKEEK